MKKAALLFILILAIGQYSRAQVITKYGDNVSTLNGIIKAYYDVIDVKKGGKVSFERDNLLHWPNAHVGVIEQTKKGNALKAMSLRQYHQYSNPYLEKNGFYEKEISRKVEHFGGLYHVWSTYESRNSPRGKVIERGINSIELYFDGKRFWVLGWFYEAESKGNKL